MAAPESVTIVVPAFNSLQHGGVRRRCAPRPGTRSGHRRWSTDGTGNGQGAGARRAAPYKKAAPPIKAAIRPVTGGSDLGGGVASAGRCAAPGRRCGDLICDRRARSPGAGHIRRRISRPAQLAGELPDRRPNPRSHLRFPRRAGIPARVHPCCPTASRRRPRPHGILEGGTMSPSNRLVRAGVSASRRFDSPATARNSC